jgi:pimeloyl-ACP methyl ester carboxylesterase
MPPLNVFVYGGGPASATVTNYSDGSLRKAGLVSRQSLISAMTGPSRAEIEPNCSLQPAALRQLNADLQGSLPGELALQARESEVVLMDLFDERFGVDQLQDGSYITRSPARVKHVVSSGPSRTIPFGSDEHFRLWCTAADQYVKLLMETRLLDVTFLLDVSWAHADERGERVEVSFGLPSAGANLAFTRYVDHLRQKGVTIVDHSETWAASNHKWGRAPYNLHDEVYHAIIEKLNTAVRESNAGKFLAHDLNWDQRHGAKTLRWTSHDQFDAGKGGRLHHVIAPQTAREQYPLRCLIQRGNSDTLLVISHGALPRTKYTLPRFEWLASLKGRSENLMFLSDTALESFAELELAWFTGDAKDDLTSRYADLVAKAAAQIGADKVLFLGGSGGGFASLALASQTPGSRALVFNPQTSIRKYWNKSVRQYANHLFPEFESLTEIDTLGSRANMVRRYASIPVLNSQIIYVQNDDDSHHMEHHLKPFAATFGMEPVNGVSKDGALRLIVDQFATGHNMPYRTVLNPFVDLALANWGAAFNLGLDTSVDRVIREIAEQANAESDSASRVPM